MRTLPRGRVFTAVSSLAIAMTVGLGACASGAAGGGSGDRVRRNPDVMDLAELASVVEVDVLTAIRRLRPTWLRTSPHGDLPRVIVDGNPLGGGLEVLQNYRTNDVMRIEHMSPADATTFYGTGYPAGAIFVTTKR